MARIFTPLWIVAGTLVLALAACGPKEAADAPRASSDAAVAVIDGREIFASDVKIEALAQGLIGPGETFDPSSDLFERTLEEVIDQRLLAAEALRQGLDKSPEGQRRLAAARDRMLAALLTDKVVDAAVNEEQIQRLYGETTNAVSTTQEVRVSQILLRTEGEANAIRAALDAGGSFETFALDRSIDSGTRFRGGDLGYVTLNMLPPDYAQALSGASPGEVVGPVAGPGGFAVLKLVERRQEQQVELTSARPLIVRFLTYDQIKDLIENLRGKAKIELKLPTVPASPAAAQAPPAAAEPAGPAISATPSSTRPGVSVDGTPAAKAPAAK